MLHISPMLCIPLLDPFLWQNWNSVSCDWHLLILLHIPHPQPLGHSYSLCLVFSDFTYKCNCLLFSVLGLQCSPCSCVVSQKAAHTKARWHSIVCKHTYLHHPWVLCSHTPERIIELCGLAIFFILRTFCRVSHDAAIVCAHATLANIYLSSFW